MVSGRKGNDIVDLGDGDDVFIRTAGGRQRPRRGRQPAWTRSARAARRATTSIEVQGSAGAHALLFGFVRLGRAWAASSRSSWTRSAGTDNVTVRDLGGTATTKVDRRSHRLADLRVDTLTVIGTQGDDTIKADDERDDAHRQRAAGDRQRRQPRAGQKLAIDARDGDDTIDAQRHHQGQAPADPQGRRRQGHDHRLPRRRHRSPAASASTSPSWAAAWTRSPGARATAATSSRARPARTSCR